MRRDLRVIRDELHCDAVRVTGGVQDRLELTARFAEEVGLEVWYCPFTNGLDRDGLMPNTAAPARKRAPTRTDKSAATSMTVP